MVWTVSWSSIISRSFLANLLIRKGILFQDRTLSEHWSTTKEKMNKRLNQWCSSKCSQRFSSFLRQKDHQKYQTNLEAVPSTRIQVKMIKPINNKKSQKQSQDSANLVTQRTRGHREPLAVMLNWFRHCKGMSTWTCRSSCIKRASDY